VSACSGARARAAGALWEGSGHSSVVLLVCHGLRALQTACMKEVLCGDGDKACAHLAAHAAHAARAEAAGRALEQP